ncbi:hypothetical protein E0H83_00950 [Acinetobacter terrestris]|uniref:hypothetical protein n=1 Tax=Acinetobacter terrestris TaxID=2529843 RepID=UPI001039191C|nr:hypothetical protein [Acinetobacter terrestris]TCB48338.1 hypothetical protein E0H83_00950 [Acinetobacter terrestris]
MAKEKQTSLRILQSAKKIPHPPISYAVSGFCMGVIFSAIAGSFYLHHFIHNKIESSLLSTHTDHFEQDKLENKPLATELDTRIMKLDIQLHQPVQDTEYSIEFSQPQENDLNKIFIPQDQSKLEAKSLNKTPVVSKETAVAP